MDYIFMQPPFETKPFKDMKKKDAQEHFEWYVGDITNRIEILRNAFEVTGGGKKEELDFSAESLIKIWNWYITKVEIYSQKISLGWMSIAMDVAIYFSECIMNKYNTIKWGYVSKPISLAYANKPVLTGFKTGIELDATNIIRNLTLKVANGEKDTEALIKLFEIWEENV